MFRHCAKHHACIAALLGIALLSACSSSPTKQTAPTTNAAAPTDSKAPVKKADAQKVDAKKADKKKVDTKKEVVEPVAAEVVPTGPPPIPPEATQQFEKALTLLGAGDYGPAAQELQRLAAAYPDYAGPLTNLGIVYLKTGKLADAEKTLKAATQRGEPSAATFNQLGIVYRKLGRFKEADEAYTQALRIDPGYALAHLNLGVLCDMYLQQPQRALSEFERYLQIAPNPDQRVAAWVKELKGRVGGGKPPTPAAESSAPSAPAASPTAGSPTGGA